MSYKGIKCPPTFGLGGFTANLLFILIFLSISSWRRWPCLPMLRLPLHSSTEMGRSPAAQSLMKPHRLPLNQPINHRHPLPYIAKLALLEFFRFRFLHFVTSADVSPLNPFDLLSFKIISQSKRIY